LAHLVPHAPHWVKCDPGLLKDQRDLRATNFFQFALAAGDQLAPGELNRPANNLAPRRQQAQERQRGGRLSAAGLAKDADRFAHPMSKLTASTTGIAAPVSVASC